MGCGMLTIYAWEHSMPAMSMNLGGFNVGDTDLLMALLASLHIPLSLYGRHPNGGECFG